MEPRRNCVSLSHNFNNEMLNTRDENNNNNSTSEWLHKIKEELSSATTSDHQQGMPRFTDMLNSPVITNYLKINEHKDYTEKLLLNTISSGFPINGDYSNSLPSSSSSSSPSSQSHRGSFSQIYPSVNISSLSESQRISNTPRPFDMNMQVLDGRLFEGNVLVPPLNSQEIRGNFTPFGLPFHHHLQQTLHHPSSSPSHQMEIYSNEPQASEGKRHNLMAPKAGETASKKPRVESRSSCPPFKVRKEKLGDRIAALQQLVSPFGKTDTASVLMEAIGYIKFLQSQIETLSVPYMRASRNRPGKTSQLGSIPQEGGEEETRDLRSRGLCLVPLSCMTYVTGDGGDGGGGVGSGFWPTPPGFGGGT
ncbi:transcription factor bHLH110-like isoform X5 [Brassica napus]|uniref:transcription factor bHLH110-like isoform X5 n=1 Tax=Brassica napus TaxID=3708 RepID=UPI000BBE93B3|nr:transcription factor bHLH110-like isoform X5 [Brassica napus]